MVEDLYSITLFCRYHRLSTEEILWSQEETSCSAEQPDSEHHKDKGDHPGKHLADVSICTVDQTAPGCASGAARCCTMTIKAFRSVLDPFSHELSVITVNASPPSQARAQSRSSMCPLRRRACIAARPPTSWEQRTATSTCPFTEVRACSDLIFHLSGPCGNTCPVCLCSPGQSLRLTAGRAAHLGHELGAAGFAGAAPVAASHGAGRQNEENRR